MIMPEIRIIESGVWRSELVRTPAHIVLDYSIDYHTSPGIIVFNDCSYPVNEGDFTLHRPGEISYSTQSSETHYLRFEIRGEGSRVFEETLSIIPSVCPSDTQQKEAYFDILKNISKSSSYSEYKKFLLLCLLLVDLAEKHGMVSDEVTVKLSHRAVVYSAVSYMREHLYDVDLSVDEIANHLGYSKTHFNRMFKEYTNKTPYSYYLYLKIVESKHLMLTTELTVAEIAERLGFCSCSNFCYIYRKYTGSTPTKFKQQYIKHPLSQ